MPNKSPAAKGGPIYASMSEAATYGDFYINIPVKCGSLALNRLVDRMRAAGFHARGDSHDACGPIRRWDFCVEWRKIPQAASEE